MDGASRLISTRKRSKGKQMYDLKDLLEYIDPAQLSYQEWCSVGMALKQEGYMASDWDSWSKADSRYKPGECFRKWGTFRNENGDFYSHAPRGARQSIAVGTPESKDFYSHAPRGARPDPAVSAEKRSPFLLTRPSRGATTGKAITAITATISTHTPLAGRDAIAAIGSTATIDFYSHAPRGARHICYDWECRCSTISTHTPLAGRDQMGTLK